MNAIYWLIPISIAILFAAIATFFWAVRSDQFKDLDSAAMDILFDNDHPVLMVDQSKVSKTPISGSRRPKIKAIPDNKT